MTKSPPLILNPRDVPSVSWAEADLLPSSLVLSSWSPKRWEDLTEGVIESAVLEARRMAQHLWLQDAGYDRDWTQAAVLLLLIESDAGYQVVLTTRAQHLRHHPGQVAFVGGRVEAGETSEQAALREALEEINLNTKDVTVLGVMPSYYTISGFAVAPVVAVMTQSAWLAQDIRVDECEVDQVFLAPLARLFDREVMRVHTFEYEGHRRQFLSVTCTVAYTEFFVWGASMAMLHNFDLALRAQWV